MTPIFKEISSNQSDSKGFTLIEILVVIVLVGILSGVAVTYLGSGNLERELLNEAKRLHALLRHASDEAIFSNREIGFIVDDDGYAFLHYDSDEEAWQPIPLGELRKRQFPEWVSVEFSRDGNQPEILGSEKSSREEIGEEPSPVPLAMLLSSAERDMFEITLQLLGDNDSRITISSNGFDPIALETGETF